MLASAVPKATGEAIDYQGALATSRTPRFEMVTIRRPRGDETGRAWSTFAVTEPALRSF